MNRRLSAHYFMGRLPKSGDDFRFSMVSRQESLTNAVSQFLEFTVNQNSHRLVVAQAVGSLSVRRCNLIGKVVGYGELLKIELTEDPPTSMQ